MSTAEPFGSFHHDAWSNGLNEYCGRGTTTPVPVFVPSWAPGFAGGAVVRAEPGVAVPSHCDRPVSKPGRWYSVYAAAVDVNDGDDDPPPNNEDDDDALCCACASWTARERSTFVYDALAPGDSTHTHP